MDLGKIAGCVTHNEDDSYTIFLNARLNREQQLESYRHELHHILNGDFYKKDVNAIESIAHNI